MVSGMETVDSCQTGGPMDVNGSCHCRAVQFEARIDPKRVGICHCTDCQTFSGSAFRTSVLVPGHDFQLVKGEPATYEKTADSGNVRQLVFCGLCGTHVYGTTPSTDNPTYSIRVGVLSQRAELRPFIQVWCRSEVPWISDIADTRRISTQ